MTYEDYSTANPEERTRHFGHPEHVRYYGRDTRLRFENVALIVGEKWMPDALNLFTKHLLFQMGMTKRE